MTAAALYDGSISGALMASAIGTISSANLFGVTYAGGQRVVLIQTDDYQS